MINSEVKRGAKDTVLRYIKIHLFQLVFTMILIGISALILTYTDFKEVNMIYLVQISVLLPPLLTSFFLGIHKESGGIKIGIINGLLYSLIMLSLIFISEKNIYLSPESMRFIIISIIASAIGGIIGVNMKK